MEEFHGYWNYEITSLEKFEQNDFLHDFGPSSQPNISE